MPTVVPGGSRSTTERALVCLSCVNRGGAAGRASDDPQVITPATQGQGQGCALTTHRGSTPRALQGARFVRRSAEGLLSRVTNQLIISMPTLWKALFSPQEALCYARIFLSRPVLERCSILDFSFPTGAFCTVSGSLLHHKFPHTTLY